MSTMWWDLNTSVVCSTKQSTGIIPSGPDPAEALTLDAQVGHDGCRGGLAPWVLSCDHYLVVHPWHDSGVAGLGGKVCCFSCRGAPLVQGFKGHCVPQNSSSRLWLAQSLSGKCTCYSLLLMSKDCRKLTVPSRGAPAGCPGRFQTCSWRKVWLATCEPNISPAFKRTYDHERGFCVTPTSPPERGFSKPTRSRGTAVCPATLWFLWSSSHGPFPTPGGGGEPCYQPSCLAAGDGFRASP